MLSAVVSTVPPTSATWTALFNWYLTSGVIAASFVIGLLLFFAFRYRARENAPASFKRGPESPWIVLAVVVIMASVLVAAGYQTFASASNIEIPKTSNSVTIHVLAYQWGWNFTYPNGSYSLNNLTVPANQVVILNITSRDVFHSFGISFLDVKEDAIPGKVNQLWFEVPRPGVYENAIRCFELCGVGHAFMIANLTVVDQAAWTTFMNSGRK
jgi:cytochrome c oxidase subunit 2